MHSSSVALRTEDCVLPHGVNRQVIVMEVSKLRPATLILVGDPDSTAVGITLVITGATVVRQKILSELLHGTGLMVASLTFILEQNLVLKEIVPVVAQRDCDSLSARGAETIEPCFGKKRSVNNFSRTKFAR